MPVLTQETKLLRTDLLASIEVSEINASKVVTRTAHYPPTGVLVISPGDRRHVDDLITALYAKSTGDGYDAVLSNVVATMTALSKIPPKDAKEEVASNTWSLAMVVSPRPYFINTRQPLIGTASSTYKLNADGTLGEATAAVTDDTAKTLLSLFPIAAKISKD